MRAIVYPSKISGSQVAPASKSSMQRACAAALLHHGQTKIFNPGYSNDDIAAIDVIQKLGVIVTQHADHIQIDSKGVHPIGPEMNCGESGLGIRMFTPIAALSSQSITIQGKGSLVKRPMHFFDDILPTLGVQIKSNHGFLPISI
ncbi:MAG: 3-phosphoshikimate 1-carboxyvinyltransferase, partial [Chitinophagaceae bacterium]